MGLSVTQIGKKSKGSKKFTYHDMKAAGYDVYRWVWDVSDPDAIPFNVGLGREVLGFNSIRLNSDVPWGGMYLEPVRINISGKAWAGDGAVDCNAAESWSSNFEAQTEYNRATSYSNTNSTADSFGTCGSADVNRLASTISPPLFYYECTSAVITYTIELNFDKTAQDGDICSGGIYAEYRAYIKPVYLNSIQEPTDVSINQI